MLYNCCEDYAPREGKIPYCRSWLQNYNNQWYFPNQKNVSRNYVKILISKKSIEYRVIKSYTFQLTSSGHHQSLSLYSHPKYYSHSAPDLRGREVSSLNYQLPNFPRFTAIQNIKVILRLIREGGKYLVLITSSQIFLSLPLQAQLVPNQCSCFPSQWTHQVHLRLFLQRRGSRQELATEI